jgi:hypothetical protein
MPKIPKKPMQVTPPSRLSPEFQKFLGGKPSARLIEVYSAIEAYIREQGLAKSLPNGKFEITYDATLSALLKAPGTDDHAKILTQIKDAGAFPA